MSTSSLKQYTRKPRVSHLVIALLLAAGGLPAHSSVAPAPVAMDSEIDPLPGDPWLEEIEFFFEILWQLLIQNPPPKMPKELEKDLSAFVEGYADGGIHTDLTLEDREYYTAVVIDFIEHLEMYPDYFSQDVYNNTMSTLADILEDLDVIVAPE